MPMAKSSSSKTALAAKAQRMIFNCCYKSGILPQFEEALANETNYPVTWGGHELTIEDYLDHVTPDLLARWNAKLPEYRTGVQDRLYCTGKVQTPPVRGPAPGARPSSQDTHCCGTFIGSKTALRTTIPPPHVVVIADLPSATKLQDLEASLSQSFGRILECRQLRADPAFVAELTFVNQIAAQQSLALYDGSSNLDGSILDVRYEAAEERAAANREAQRVRDEQQLIRNERQRIEDEARRQLENARREEAMEAERRRRENAPIASSTEYQRMLKVQNELKTLRTFSRSRLPIDPWYSLLGILPEELEVHVAHLRAPDGRPLYHLRPAAIAANRAIKERIIHIGLERLAPITMLPILSHYNDAWHGEQNLKEVANSVLGRIRYRHQLAIQEVFRLLPLDLAHIWILRMRDLCVLLDLGTERYVRSYRVLRESQEFADTL
ncbi:Putative nucleotide-binding alpha-beta plait domain superfamily, RNA-binding domain superfamily [Septoria linicola]|uniref:Nucleotide-binding alpha-beta plait domain superfamily, RNA-binding domain superfamily n=1 Tax=Septoria linicola TaxID=215465 RepID=A0A9Q9AQT6_9PEZI|nr:putative nucleotide-binding alpha-beta plait domain superfamily, RNA-binding domain superfamily [Septoria linicola]USW51428.1 Putative nucleotide-binding alpha-beta plait domain superfamily, RNA-binding domain superfamily [Septoria linicola]